MNKIIFGLILIAAFSKAVAETKDKFRVAVASNFLITLKQLRSDFVSKTEYYFSISPASTGKLYAQISYGAPYDLFFSADEKRADLLIKNNGAVNGLIYARGLLVLLAKKESVSNCTEDIGVILNNRDTRLAIANPKTAPYGAAAKQVLEKYNVWKESEKLLIKGESIIQAHQFLMSGSVEQGFIAKSLLNDSGQLDSFCKWDVPVNDYSPINQKVVILKRSKDKLAVKAFFSYIQSNAAKNIIRENGYFVK